MTALATLSRPLFGIDTDPVALALAHERLPRATLIEADLLNWSSPAEIQARCGLVVAGGDLLPLFTDQDELQAIFAQGSQLLHAGGLFGIDATLIDAELLREATVDAMWGEDVRWVGDDGVSVRRESRLLPDANGRARLAQLQIRHWYLGESEPDEREPFTVRAWSVEEVEEAAAAVGLAVTSRGSEDRLRWLLRSTHA